MQLGKAIISTTGLAVASISMGGCATEDYVDKHIAVVNQRIDGVEQHLATVEGTANQANQTAQAAMGAAQQANQRLDQLTSRVDAVEQKMVTRRPHG